MANMKWTDYYDKFEEIIDRFWDEGEDRISEEVDKYYETVKGDPEADEAYRRWSEPASDRIGAAEEFDDREMTNDDWAYDIIEHFTEITGRPVKDVYNHLYVPDGEEQPAFDDNVVEETYNAIQDYLLSKGVDLSDVEDIWYALDDALTARREELDQCDVVDNTDDYIQGAAKMPRLASDAEGIADKLSEFLDATSRISNLDDFLDEDDLSHLSKSMDALYDFAQSYSYDEGYR